MIRSRQIIATAKITSPNVLKNRNCAKYIMMMYRTKPSPPAYSTSLKKLPMLLRA